MANTSSFASRHLGSTDEEVNQMLKEINTESIESLISETIPADIRLPHPIQIPEPQTEYDFLISLKEIAQKNKIYQSFIGAGYFNTITPSVIQRNILENPGWYTAYTPYQAEIAQGRLEALINFQTMVTDLTGMEIANASLLDEATAAAEAMTMLYSLRSNEKRDANTFFVSDQCYTQTIDVLKTRAEPLGIKLLISDYKKVDVTRADLFGLMLQYPAADGSIIDYSNLISSAKENTLLVAMATDLMALTLLKSPGEMGADVAIGSSQRFGVPMGFGGPHAAFFATKDAFKRNIPGRIIGVSIDAKGKKAYRMSLQTREQHIRREKASSNICTAQVLLAVMAGMYAVYHGPKGLREIALKINSLAASLADILKSEGFAIKHNAFFDTLSITLPEPKIKEVRLKAEAKKLNFNYQSQEIRIALDETSNAKSIEEIVSCFCGVSSFIESLSNIPEELLRTSPFLNHPVFNKHHSEHELLRYMKRLENKDLSLVHSMIPLGSCTMKLNATTEMLPVTWPEFSQIHPFAPKDQTEGYQQLFKNLEEWLCEITGFSAISLQPNSGAQGEYAGLMVIRNYLKNKHQEHRNIALIPSSAHGTNPASAVMAGMKVVIVKCDDHGNVDLDDLKKQADAHKDDLACLMITYPSTHGVFETDVREICTTIHTYGGQVYMDGANMNAQVGLTSPGFIGADVCHLNLHKTFCIPHGGGGPGMGPIGVAKHLVPFLPGHSVIQLNSQEYAVSAAPWGSASILPISYAYISMMGSTGLTSASTRAILHANYIKSKLEKYYSILYSGKNNRCAHELIVDCRGFKSISGIEVEDIAKRLMDYGFHAPTVSFPVAGTLMIEPTESESKEELDRFCEAMINIRKEIEEIEKGTFSKEHNVLKNAPHTMSTLTEDAWEYPYSRQKAAYPLAFVKESKYWPTVSRIDNAYGDRNLVCTCIPIEEYEEVNE